MGGTISSRREETVREIRGLPNALLIEWDAQKVNKIDRIIITWAATNPESEGNFNLVPKEILVDVLEYLNWIDFMVLSKVSRYFYVLTSSDNPRWREMCLLEYPEASSLITSSETNFKKLYLYCQKLSSLTFTKNLGRLYSVTDNPAGFCKIFKITIVGAPFVGIPNLISFFKYLQISIR
jgi:hypothetical protein